MLNFKLEERINSNEVILVLLQIIYHLNRVLKKLLELIKNIVERLFNYCGIDLKYFKLQYDPEIKRKEESRFKGFNLFNKKSN